MTSKGFKGLLVARKHGLTPFTRYLKTYKIRIDLNVDRHYKEIPKTARLYPSLLSGCSHVVEECFSLCYNDAIQLKLVSHKHGL